MEKQDFLNLVSPLVMQENERRGKPLFASVVIAQAILETGWGKSQMMMKSHAIFGIKATTTWKGKVYSSITKECYDGVKNVNIKACFRAYDSYEESIKDYFTLICESKRYKKALNQKSQYDCIFEIKSAGYATDPKYVSSIMKIIADNDLISYDLQCEDCKYYLGRVYTLNVDLCVRVGAGTNYRRKSYLELTKNAKENAYKQLTAVLKKGTRVTCQGIYIDGKNIWLKIPSGFVAAYYDGKYYIS